MALPTDLNRVICLSEVRPFALPDTSSNRSPRMSFLAITPRRSGMTMSPASRSARSQRVHHDVRPRAGRVRVCARTAGGPGVILFAALAHLRREAADEID